MNLKEQLEKEFPDIEIRKSGDTFDDDSIYILHDAYSNDMQETFDKLKNDNALVGMINKMFGGNPDAHNIDMSMIQNICGNFFSNFKVDIGSIIKVYYKKFNLICKTKNIDDLIASIKRIKTNDLKPENKCIICYDEKEYYVHCATCLCSLCIECYEKILARSNGNAEMGTMSVGFDCPQCKKSFSIECEIGKQFTGAIDSVHQVLGMDNFEDVRKPEDFLDKMQNSENVKNIISKIFKKRDSSQDDNLKVDQLEIDGLQLELFEEGQLQINAHPDDELDEEL